MPKEIEIQICTRALKENQAAATQGVTDPYCLEPCVIVRDETGSHYFHRVVLECGAEVRPYVSNGVFGVRVYAPHDAELELDLRPITPRIK